MELRVLDDVYSVRDFIAGLVADVIAGPVHTVFTGTGTFTAVLNSTVQVRVGEDPDRMGLGVLDIRLTTGWGTMCTIIRNNDYTCTANCMSLQVYFYSTVSVG